MIKRIKEFLANPYLHSWLATALAFMALDAQNLLIALATGDWTWELVKGIGFVALRSLVKALIVMVFPQLPIQKPNQNQ